MSMPITAKAWLWELLDFGCGIDEGRLAYLPEEDIVISSFKVLTETGKEHQIKTISSGCKLEDSVDEESIVKAVRDRRVNDDGQTEYLVDFVDGGNDWLLAKDFIDDDGTTNLAWLSFANASDFHDAFSSFTHNQLKVMLLLFASCLRNDHFRRIFALFKVGSQPETRKKCSNEL